MDGALAVLMAAVDQAFQRKSWHGPNLRGALRGVTAEQAAWRPAPGRHNIWELALHTAYWKYIVARRLRGGARGAFPLPGRDFFARPYAGGAPDDRPAGGRDVAPPAISETDWRRELELLSEMHRQLRAAIAALPPGAIDRPSAPSSKSTARDLILGAAAHDLYHAGQIQLLKRLREGSKG
jgi:DinB superfamily